MWSTDQTSFMIGNLFRKNSLKNYRDSEMKFELHRFAFAAKHGLTDANISLFNVKCKFISISSNYYAISFF